MRGGAGLRVETASDGRGRGGGQVGRPDGGLPGAQTIESPPPVSGGGSPVDIGFGIGSFGSRGGVGTGVGVSTGTTVGGGSSSSAVGPSTIASFPLAQAGPSPWRGRVQLQGTELARIPVGGPPGSPAPPSAR